MKKKTIWIIAIIMGLSFLGLLLLQLNYIEEMAEMKKEQVDESVNRALYQASRNMELNETLRYLEDDVNKTERLHNDAQAADKAAATPAHQAPSIDNQGDVYTSFEAKLKQSKPSLVPKGSILRSDSSSLSATKRNMQEIVRNRYVYQKAMLEEVIYNILYSDIAF